MRRLLVASQVRSTYPTNVSLQRAATKSVANTSNPLIMTTSVEPAGSAGFYSSLHQVTCPNHNFASHVGVSTAGFCHTLMVR